MPRGVRRARFFISFAFLRKKIRKTVKFATLFATLALASLSEAISAQGVVFLADTINAGEVVDTLDTDDRYTKLVLYADRTWAFVDLGHPKFDEEDFAQYWDNDEIHSYKGISMDEVPDEILLTLVDSASTFVSPVVGGVRSRYAFRRRRPHRGTDIPLRVGDPVRAAFDGKVRVVKKTRQSGGYGNLVVIRHANGLETYYGHLSQHSVAENDLVRAGDVIGYGGSTGRSTGPHLHFETRFMGQAFDPERLIDFERGALREEQFMVKKHYFSIYSHYGQTDDESVEASKRKIHTIRGGDTLGGLAARYGTTVSAICKLNGFRQSKLLRIGERIIVR